MSWDQPAFSFGTPNAQPPTPTKTPTSANLPSPVFHTPMNKPSSFEDRGSWTPTFAEEYSVFNSTPGRLTGNHPSFADFGTPRPLTSPTFDRRLSSTDKIAAELATHVHHLSPNPNLPLPPVDPSNQLPSSPGVHILGPNPHKTPRKPARKLEDPFSGQTATPPASQSKGTKKLAPKLSSNTMQNEHQDGQFGISQTPTHAPYMMDYPTTSGEFFNYPMSAPASAPLFTDAKPFWDQDQSMGGMEMDFSTDNGNIFNTSGHRVSNSFDWGRSNQIFQQEVNNPAPESYMPRPGLHPKRARPLAPKVDLSDLLKNTPALPEFQFHDPSQPRPQPVKQPESAVDPANLWSRPTTSMAPPSDAASISPTRPSSSNAQLQPYSQQVRESLRDQQEYQEHQAERLRERRRSDRAVLSSPVRGSARPGLHRSMSENRGRKSQDRVMSRPGGRVSPLKRVTGLSSIPETASSMRTEIKFVIDKNGRASTETTMVNNRPRSFYEDVMSQSDTSDEEPHMSFSRNTSFDLPRQQAPKLGRSESTGRSGDPRKHMPQNSYSHSESSRSSQRSRRGSLDSEAETVMAHDPTGDATQEIRKMMQARKQVQFRENGPGSASHRNPSDLRPRPSYYAPSSNVSPSGRADLDGTTPSSTRSGTTRCVCKNADSEGFMIQCESCDCWLHTECVGIDQHSLPPVYICAFCAQTPSKRGPRVRDMARSSNQGLGVSSLTHKSFQSFR